MRRRSRGSPPKTSKRDALPAGLKTPLGNDTARDLKEEKICPPKMIRRFYEPLSLLYTLDMVRGDRLKSERLVDENDAPNIRENRRRFTDAIAYICAHKRAGEYVTAAAIESRPEHVVVWIAANCNIRPNVVEFLRRVLSTVHSIVERPEVQPDNDSENLLFSQLSKMILSFNAPRIFSYYREIIDKIACRCLGVMPDGSKSPATNVGVSEFRKWFQKNMYRAGMPLQETDMEALARECYASCREGRFEVLNQFSGQGQSQGPAFERFYELLCKLGKHLTMTKRLITAATHLRQDFGLGFSVATVPSSEEKPIPLLKGQSTIEKIAGRMFTEREQRNLFLSRLGAIYTDKELSEKLADYHESVCTKVHAELLLIDHFERNGGNFLDDNDRYIGCSKPSCYLCYWYICFHRGYTHPSSHQKLYLGWRLPDIGEEEPARWPQQRKILLNLIERVRGDLDHEINNRTGRRKPHADSTAGLSSVTKERISRTAQQYGEPVSSEEVKEEPIRYSRPPTPDTSKISPDYSPSPRRNAIGRDDEDSDEDKSGGVILPARGTRTSYSRQALHSLAESSRQEPTGQYSAARRPAPAPPPPQCFPPPRMGDYTSLLWQEGQARRIKPKIVEEPPIRLSPQATLFKVTIQFGEFQGTGHSETKKAAKHIASQEVCSKLGIFPTLV